MKVDFEKIASKWSVYEEAASKLPSVFKNIGKTRTPFSEFAQDVPKVFDQLPLSNFAESVPNVFDEARRNLLVRILKQLFGK